MEHFPWHKSFINSMKFFQSSSKSTRTKPEGENVNANRQSNGKQSYWAERKINVSKVTSKHRLTWKNDLVYESSNLEITIAFLNRNTGYIWFFWKVLCMIIWRVQKKRWGGGNGGGGHREKLLWNLVFSKIYVINFVAWDYNYHKDNRKRY